MVPSLETVIRLTQVNYAFDDPDQHRDKCPKEDEVQKSQNDIAKIEVVSTYSA